MTFQQSESFDAFSNIATQDISIYLGSNIACLFTPPKNLVVSGLETYLGTEAGTSTDFIFGVRDWAGGSPSTWLGSKAQTNTSTGWKDVYFDSNINLTSGINYCTCVIPGSGVANTTNYIRVRSLNPLTQTKPNITDFTVIDSSANVYVSPNSGVSWNPFNKQPVFTLIQSDGSGFGQPYYDVVSLNMSRNNYVGQLVEFSSNIYVTDVAFNLVGYLTTVPTDDCRLQLRSGVDPYVIIGSWMLCGSQDITRANEWSTASEINHNMLSGVPYLLTLVSATSATTPFCVNAVYNIKFGSFAGFKSIDSAAFSMYPTTQTIKQLNSIDFLFQINGSPYSVIESQAFSQFVAETLTAADSQWFDVNKRSTDTLTVADSHDRVWTAYRTLPETLAMAESLRKAETHLVSDTLTVADDVIKLLMLQIDKIVAETLVFSDSNLKNYKMSKTETLAIVESLRKQITMLNPETLNLAENFLQEMLFSRTFTELFLISDANIKDIRKFVSNTLAIADYNLKVRIVEMIVSENLTISEAIRKIGYLVKMESLVVSDKLIKTILHEGATPTEFASKLTDDIAKILMDDIRDTFKVPLDDDLKIDDDIS